MRLKYLLVIPCFLLVVVIKISASWGLADFENQKARVFIKQWENNVDSFSSDDWDKAYSTAKAALEKDPHNPELFSLLGNVYEWNSFQGHNQSHNNQFQDKQNFINARIARHSLSRILQAAVATIGLQSDRYAMRSLRNGCITWLAMEGLSTYRIMEHSGHKRMESMQSYLQPVRSIKSCPLAETRWCR